MKLERKINFTAVYQGIHPVANELGNKKYIGYDHLFKDVEGPSFMYSYSRAKKLPKEIPIGSKVRIKANWRSSIITNIVWIQILS